MELTRRIAGTVAAFAALFGILWFRVGPVTHGTLWAEDGSLFLSDAVDGVSWLEPYAGYTHLIPRAIATIVTTVLPISGWAIGVAVFATAAAAAIGVLVFHLSGTLPIGLVGRVGLALATALVPSLATETLGELANFHWLVLWASPFLFLHRPRSYRSAVPLGLLALVFAATEPQSLVFAPLFLVHLRDRRRWPIIAGSVLGWIPQAVAVFGAPRTPSPYGPADPASIALGFSLQTGGGLWVVPLTPLAEAVRDHGWIVAALTLVPPIVCAVLLIVLVRRLRVLTIALVGASVIVFVAAWLANLGDWQKFDYANMTDAALVDSVIVRYALAPSLMMLGVMVLAVDRGLASVSRLSGWRAVATLAAAVALGAALVTTSVVNYDQSEHTTRTNGPTWQHSLDEMAAACTELPANEPVGVPIAPEGWNVGLTCAQIAADRP